MAKKKDKIGEADTGEETPPEGGPKTTPEPEPGPKPELKEETFTLTKTERTNLINAEKATIGRELRDALSVNTTLKTTMDRQTTRLTVLEADNKAIRDAARAKEIEDAQGNTPVIDEIKLKHKNEDDRLTLTNERSDFTQEKAQHQAKLDKLAESEATELAKELAKTSGLTADLLLQIGSDTTEDERTVYNLDRMKTIASKSPKGEEEEEREEESGATVKGLRAKAASTGRAATGLRTFADFEKAYVAGEISREEYGKAAKRFNIQL